MQLQAQIESAESNDSRDSKRVFVTLSSNGTVVGRIPLSIRKDGEIQVRLKTWITKAGARLLADAAVQATPRRMDPRTDCIRNFTFPPRAECRGCANGAAGRTRQPDQEAAIGALVLRLFGGRA